MNIGCIYIFKLVFSFSLVKYTEVTLFVVFLLVAILTGVEVLSRDFDLHFSDD